MMRSASSTVLVLLFLALAAAPASAAGKPSSGLPQDQIELVIELRHPRGLDGFVRAVSDPGSASYRRYSTVQRLIDRYGAREKKQKQALAWFSRRGVRARPLATGSFLVASLDRRRAGRLLVPAGGARASAVGPRRVPRALRGSVRRIELLPPVRVGHDVLLPSAAERAAVASGAKKKKGKLYSSAAQHSGTAAGCAEGREAVAAPEQPFTPNQFLTAYGHAALQARGLEGQGQTIAVVEGGGFRRSDVVTFDSCFGVKTPPLEVDPVAPIHKPLPPQDETTLDLETLSVGAPKVDRIRVYEGAESPLGVLLTTAAALGRPGRQPNVISMSLGYCEPLLSGQLVIKRAFDNVLAVAAGAGISVLISAGDQGSSGCRAGPPGEEQTELPVLAVAQPSSSPYATAVGGTNFTLTRKNRIKAEGTWNDQPYASAGTGGGTSLLTPTRPWWQRSVHRYGLGRVVPDVSALADIFPGYAFFCTAPECLEEGQPFSGWSSVGGTSAAAPLTAAGIALANQYAAERGQPPLGFLNPLLYRLGRERATRERVFNDVTIGNNDLGRMLLPEVGGGAPLGCCSARKSYDWATGWGSLKMVPFAEAAAALAQPSVFLAAG